jgi:hypothetical protein
MSCVTYCNYPRPRFDVQLQEDGADVRIYGSQNSEILLTLGR